MKHFSPKSDLPVALATISFTAAACMWIAVLSSFERRADRLSSIVVGRVTITVPSGAAWQMASTVR
jgi:hypothetical protein